MNSKLMLTQEQLENRVNHSESPVFAACDTFFGSSDWSELDADRMADAILAAIEAAWEQDAF